MKEPMESPSYNVAELQNREKEVEEFENQSKTVFKMGYLGMLFDQHVINLYISIKYKPKLYKGVMYVLPFEYIDGEAKVYIDGPSSTVTLIPLKTNSARTSFIKCVWIQYIRTVTGCYIPYHELPSDPDVFTEAVIGPVLKKYNKKTFPQDYSPTDNNKKHHSYPREFLYEVVEVSNNRMEDMYMSDIFDLLSDDFVAREITYYEYGKTDSNDNRLTAKLLMIDENLFINSNGIPFEFVSVPAELIYGTISRLVPANVLELCSNIKEYAVLLPVDWVTPELIRKYKALYEIFMSY